MIAQSGVLMGQRWQIDRALTIGRDISCDIVVQDRQISRYHARLTPDEGGVVLEDLGSKNGTFCNNKLVEEALRLDDGDMIQVALTQQFVFLASDATMPLDSGMLPSKPVKPVTGSLPRERQGRLYLDDRSRRVWIGREEVLPPLSAPQFRLLQLLYERSGQVVSRAELVNVVWGESESLGVSEQALDALVRRLRDRLALLDPTHAYMVTIRGHGLRLDNPKE
ncbi:MAG TPA: FHA domain-containing protein [Anaerolineaceae bacterium]